MLNIDDNAVYAGVAAFIATIIPEGTVIQRGQQNRVPMPKNSCVIITTLGAPERIGTNEDETEPADNVQGFSVSVTADFMYQVQADFYGAAAESWAMSVEIVWRDKIAFASMPSGMKPLYSDGRQQLPLVGAENQWIQRWTMTLVLDYQPTWTQATQAATAATVIPEPVDVFFSGNDSDWTADSNVKADSSLTADG